MSDVITIANALSPGALHLDELSRAGQADSRGTEACDRARGALNRRGLPASTSASLRGD
jgi:hypothetical protein